MSDETVTDEARAEKVTMIYAETKRIEVDPEEVQSFEAGKWVRESEWQASHSNMPDRGMLAEVLRRHQSTGEHDGNYVVCSCGRLYLAWWDHLADAVLAALPTSLDAGEAPVWMRFDLTRGGVPV